MSASDDIGLGRMSFREHLTELRSRLFRATIAVGVAFFIAWAFHVELYAFLSAPVREALAANNLFSIKALHITESIETYMKLSLVGALFLASPYVFWQLWAFIAPGLLAREKRLAVPIITGSVACFFLGALFCYLIVLPYMTDFLIRLTLDAPGMAFEPTLASTVSFSLLLLVAFGAVFELPLFMYVMAAAGIAGWRGFLGFYRYWIVVAFVIGAILTPTPDPINQTLMSAPLVLLYGVGIGIAWLVEGRGQLRERLTRRRMVMVAAVVAGLAVAGAALALRERDPGPLGDVPGDVRQLVGLHHDNAAWFAQQAEGETKAAVGLSPFQLPALLQLLPLHDKVVYLARFDAGFALLLQVPDARRAVARLAVERNASLVQSPSGPSVWFALPDSRRVRAVAAGSKTLWLGDDVALDRLSDVRRGKSKALLADEVLRKRVTELRAGAPLWSLVPDGQGSAAWLPGGALANSVRLATAAVQKDPVELDVRFETKGQDAAVALRDRIDAWVADVRASPAMEHDPRLRELARRVRALSLLVARATEASARGLGQDHPDHRALMVVSTEAVELSRDLAAAEQATGAPLDVPAPEAPAPTLPVASGSGVLPSVVAAPGTSVAEAQGTRVDWKLRAQPSLLLAALLAPSEAGVAPDALRRLRKTEELVPVR